MKYWPTIVIVLVISLLGSVFVFAEESNPGDSLYKIKTSVSEPIAGIFSFTKEEKAEWQERLIERRLKESEKLASVNELSEAGRVDIENSIKNQFEKFLINIKDLTLQENNIKEISNIYLRLQAALDTYQNILEKISQKADIDENTKKEIISLRSTIKKVENEVAGYRKNIESNVGLNNEVFSIPFSAAQKKQNITEETLNETKLLYQKYKLQLPVNVQNQIDENFSGAENAILEGKTFINTADYINAVDKFKSAIDLTNKVKLTIFSNLIRKDIKRGEDEDNEYEIEEEFDN